MPNPPDAPRFLFEGQDAFDALSASLADTVLILEPDGVVSYAAPGVVAILGITPQVLEGQPLLAFVHPEDRVHEEAGGFWQAPLPFEREFRMRGVGGDWVWVRVLSGATDRSGERLASADRILGDRTLLLLRDRRSDAQVRDADDLLHRAFDAVNNLVVVTDMRLPGNPLVMVNQNFVDATGYPREEIIGRNCRFLQVRPDGTRDNTDDGQAEALDEIRRAISSGTSTHALLRNYRKDGTRFYNRLYLTPIRTAAGELTHYVGVQNDVTAEIEQRDEAERRRRLLRAFFDSAPFLMGVVEDRDGEVRHQTANEAALDLFRSAGAQADRIEGASLTALGFSAAEADLWERHVRTCAKTGEPSHFRTVFPWGAHPDAPDVRLLDVVVNTAERGEPPLFSYVAEDVTERRRSDTERRLLAAAVEQAAEPIVVTGIGVDEPGPRILYANEAHARTFGYTVPEIIGRSPRMFQGPKTDRAVLDRVRARLEAGEPVQAEAINYRKDGSEFVLQWEIAPVRNDAGEVVNWVGTQRDVTERRQLEREILEVAAREQERMARDLHDGLGQVLTGAAFRLQALYYALDGTDQADLAADALRTRQLVEGALEQARAIARGLFPINIEPDEIHDALARLAADAAMAFDVTCSFEGDATITAPTREHAAHLYRIAQEALANAARHGRAKTIEVGLTRAGDHAMLTVRDDGIGISDTALAGGEGLGLRTMRYRADRVGGEFEVRHREGGGTVVAVTFEPAQAEEEE